MGTDDHQKSPRSDPAFAAPHSLPVLTVLLTTTVFLFAALLILTLNGYDARADPDIHGVEIGSDSRGDHSGDPGGMVSYDITITNTGNANDSFEVFILHGDLDDSAKHWTRIDGLPENSPGNASLGSTGTIAPGEWIYLDLIIEIPIFTTENDAARAGIYDLLFIAQSTGNRSVTDESIFNVTVNEYFSVDLRSDFPGKDGILNEYTTVAMTFDLDIMNLGNTADDIIVFVPIDELSGEKSDWTARFGTQTSKQVTLDPLSQQSVSITLMIDKNTDPGNYELRVRAESQGDTTAYVYSTLYINLSKAQYGVELEKFPATHREVNPADEAEIEFKFALTNTGNQVDTYTIEVETPLGSGVYKGWTMEFEDKTNSRVDQLVIPTDLKGNTNLYLSKNSRVDITLYVIVAIDEDEGNYGDIAISATSDNDNAQTQYLYFNLTVILPNIRITDNNSEFSIEPDSGIKEDDNIDISVRIYNDGGAETKTFWVFFYNGKSDSPTDLAGNYIALEKVDNIPPGQYTDVLATWHEIPGGENDIYVYADKPVKTGDGKTLIDNSFSDEGLVLESKENDNTRSISDEAQEAIDLRPDLTIIGVDFDDREQGKTTTVTVTVANVGSAKALQGSAQVSLKIGGTSMKDKRTNAINPFLPEEIDINDDIDIEFKWDIPNEDKNFTVKIVVDHTDDSNNGNDRMSTGVQTEEDNCCGPDSDLIGRGMGFFSTFVALGIITTIYILSKRKSPQKKQVRRRKRIPTALIVPPMSGQSPRNEDRPETPAPHSSTPSTSSSTPTPPSTSPSSPTPPSTSPSSTPPSTSPSSPTPPSTSLHSSTPPPSTPSTTSPPSPSPSPTSPSSTQSPTPHSSGAQESDSLQPTLASSSPPPPSGPATDVEVRLREFLTRKGFIAPSLRIESDGTPRSEPGGPPDEN